MSYSELEELGGEEDMCTLLVDGEEAQSLQGAWASLFCEISNVLSHLCSLGGWGQYGC